MLLQSLQTQIQEMKDKIRETADIQSQLSKIKKEYDEVKEVLEKSEVERKEVKRYAADLVERVKRDTEQQEFMIDRRLINKFLVNYVNPASSHQTRMQMLDAMSKILAFTIEEKQTLGLAKK